MPTAAPMPQPPAKQQNVWMIVSIILAVALVATLGFTFMKLNQGTGDDMKPLTADEASKNLISFINQVYGAQVGNATLKGVSQESGLYKVIVNITANGQPLDQTVYVSRDGKLFIPQVVNVADVTAQYQNLKNQPQNQPGNPAPTNANTNAATNANVNAETNANTNAATNANVNASTNTNTKTK